MKERFRFLSLTCFVFLSIPGVAWSHPFHFAGGSINVLSGILHPLSGIDHSLTLLAIGVGFSQPVFKMKAKSLLLYPVFMLLGGSTVVLSADFYDGVNADSVFELTGVLFLICAVKLANLPSTVMMCAFAVWHGRLYAYDMLLDCQAWRFTLGFLLSTTFLIFCGALIQRWLLRLKCHIDWGLQHG